ncbi:DUF4139 domain-containing protein [Afifella sp. IM 167]|uniref:DUF4139 domain-containing protein n=1 Tax=Afifella sp. IM 167 TaxID=2033586 RepID=UPI001CCBB25C|nr:DUF4139 domain-containing protein [Afifella sp. IM 167]MBZ8133333.1 hypothetical protein [Afifella sp. IM 167]
MYPSSSARRRDALTLPAAAILLALPSLLLPSPAAALDAAPVTEVTLSSGGLAEIVRRAHVAGDAELSVSVPSDQVDDVLKSLLVSDPSGTVTGAALPGPDGTVAAFRTMPFQPSDMRSPGALMAALVGARAKAERDGSTYEGRVLGVSERKVGEGASETLLSLATDAGEIVSVPLDGATRLTLEDEALKAKLAEAIDILAASRTEGTLDVEVSLAGEGERDVAIRYVVPAPVWKTAHRLVLPGEQDEEGRARMQSWAVIENFSGADWQGVRLSLTSGEPVTLRQSLHAAHWANRQEVPVSEAPDIGMPQAQFRAKGALDQLQAGLAEMSRGDAAPAPMAAAPISAPTEEAATAESEVAVTYTIPWPVDLGEGKSLTLPVVDRQMEAERLSVFALGSASVHPRAAVRLVNSAETSLAPGIVTLFDPVSGYTGDAMLPAVAPGADVTVAFASDRKVKIAVSRKPDEHIVSARVADGSLVATRRHRAVTTYDVTGAADAPRSLRIEQPRRPGWQASVEGGTREKESDANRLLVRTQIPAGARQEVRLTEERLVEESYGLSDIDADFILTVASAEGTPPDLAASLKEIAALRAREREAEAALQSAEGKVERLTQNQQRLRQNLAAAPRGSDLANRFLDDLAASEDEILRAMDAAEAARRSHQALKAELEEKVAGL